MGKLDSKYFTSSSNILFVVVILWNAYGVINNSNFIMTNIHNLIFSKYSEDDKILNYHVYLTPGGRVTHICVSKLTTIGSNKALVAWSAPSHYLGQCWDIIN